MNTLLTDITLLMNTLLTGRRAPYEYPSFWRAPEKDTNGAPVLTCKNSAFLSGNLPVTYICLLYTSDAADE